MRICDSEENRRKLAWLVPGYILLAWFFCVVFQPLGLSSVPGQGNNNDHKFYRYQQWNCSLEVVAGSGMDGVTDVVDLRQEETDTWDRAACPDYVEMRSRGSVVREELCGHWDIKRDQRLVMAGRDRNIVGYCYEDR